MFHCPHNIYKTHSMSVPGQVRDEMTEKELEVVTRVFRSFETGLREATILPKVKTLMNLNEIV